MAAAAPEAPNVAIPEAVAAAAASGRFSSDEKTETGSMTAEEKQKMSKEEERTANNVDEGGFGAREEEDMSSYPTGLKLVLIVASLCLAVFLVALDQTIIAPALGAITAEFKSVKDIVRA